MNLKLIAGWKTAYKLYSVQIGIVILLASVLDVVLRSQTSFEVPVWFFYLTGPGVMIARVVQQFFSEPDYASNPNNPVQ